jgi:hypothetical protein
MARSDQCQESVTVGTVSEPQSPGPGPRAGTQARRRVRRESRCVTVPTEWHRGLYAGVNSGTQTTSHYAILRSDIIVPWYHTYIILYT